jgi:hypothetical protein
MENTAKSEKSNDSQYVQLYIESMSKKELLAYSIAKSHLGTSFEIEKSVGYLKWKKSYVDSNRL